MEPLLLSLPLLSLTWNLRAGGATAAATSLATLLHADLVLLQETRSPLWPGRNKKLWHAVPGRRWGSAILVRTGSLQPLDLDTYPGWVTGAKWVNSRMPGLKELFVFSVHSPSPRKGERKGSYTQRSLEIVQAIHARVPTTAPVVIGGDFNLASLGERLASETLPHDKRESAALATFRSLGFVVAWRDLHEGQPLPQTLRWTGNTATPFHLDGFLVRGNAVTPRHCEVLNATATRDQSDHMPVVLWTDA